MGSSIYTTILAQYAGIPERLLQWYVNERPVGPTNTVFNVKYDGLNSYLRFKHDINQTYGTFMLKVNGTKWKDTLNLPSPQQIPSLLGSPKSFVNKVVTKVVNGNILSDAKATTNPQSDMSGHQFLAHDKHMTTNRKFRPEIIRLGQDRKQKPIPRSYYVGQDSIVSSRTNLAPDNNKESGRKFLKEVIHLGQNRRQKSTNNQWKHQPAHVQSLEKNIHKSIVPENTISSTPSPDFSEFKLI